MKKISVIIPMYNSFQLMERLLKSLTLQKSANIEVIVIDDCSEDNSYYLAKNYAEKVDLKIVVFKNKVNGGPGYSRNQGLKHATGDYITFVDSDDYLSNDFSKELAPLLEKNVDCVIFDYKNVDEIGNEISLGKSIGINKIDNGFVDSKIALVYTYGSTCGKIYKRDLIINNKITFAELFRNDDMPFTKTALALANTIYYTPKPLYFYVQRQESLMHREELIDEKNAQIAFSILKDRLKEKNFYNELLAIELREVLNNTVLIKIAKKCSKKEISKFIDEHYRKEHINNIYFSAQPRYLRIITYCSYYKLFFFLSLIWKYKFWKRNKHGKNIKKVKRGDI